MPSENSPLDDPQTQAKVLALLGSLHSETRFIKESIVRIETAHAARLVDMEKRVGSLERLAAKATGIAVVISTLFSLAFQYVVRK